MPNIMLVDNDEKFRDALKKEFERIETEVEVSSTTDAAKNFETFLPDLVIMDYSDDEDLAIKNSKQIMNLDSTTCIFGLTSKEKEAAATDASYSWGARILITKPDSLDKKEDVKALMEQMVSACNDLDKDECVRCWLSNRYEKFSSA